MSRASPSIPLRLAALVAVALMVIPGLTGCGIAFLVEEPVDAAAFTGFKGRLVDFESGQAVSQARVLVKRANSSERRPYYVFTGQDGGFKLSQFVLSGEVRPFAPGERYILIFTSNDHRLKRYPVTFQGGAQDLGLIELLPLRIGGEVLPVIEGSLDADTFTQEPTQLRVGPPVP